MGYLLRNATEKDFRVIYSLIREFAAFIKTPEKVSITAEQMVADKDIFKCIVAVDDRDGIVGFATYFFTYYSWVGKCLYLDDLYVTHTHRGNQLGSQLMDMIFDIAKENNCKKVRWQVSNWNEKAISFYKKRGATIDEVEINCDVYL